MKKESNLQIAQLLIFIWGLMFIWGMMFIALIQHPGITNRAESSFFKLNLTFVTYH